jgi:hypothetical protein
MNLRAVGSETSVNDSVQTNKTDNSNMTSRIRYTNKGMFE